MNDLEQCWREDLRTLEAHIDPQTARRLAAARRAALERASTRRLGPRWLAPITGAALACGLTLWILAPQIRLANPEPPNALSSAESIELYEHLDFYSWLANSQWDREQG